MSEHEQTEQKQASPMTFGEAVALARQGNREVLPAIRRMLQAHPELYQEYGNLAWHAEHRWLEKIAKGDGYLEECLRQQTDELRANLAGTDPSPLETLQVERIVALHLQLSYYEAMLGSCQPGTPNKLLEYLHRQHASADHRLQRALQGLARLRRLLPQTIRVEVNVSGELQTTVPETETTESKSSPLQVPRNRLKDLYAIANN